MRPRTPRSNALLRPSFRGPHADAGMVMVLAVITVAVVAVMGAALVTTAVRDLGSSGSVQRATSALGVAEAAIQRSMKRIGTVGPAQARLSEPVPDKSDDGVGRWMNPTDPTAPPSVGDLYEGVMESGTYNAYIVVEDPIDMTADPPDTTGVYRIVARAVTSREGADRPGIRRVEQTVRVAAMDMPFGIFARDGVTAGGNPEIRNISLYTNGDIFWRSLIQFDGWDDYYGGPAAAHASGIIYAGGVPRGNQNTQIHPPSPNCAEEGIYAYDRDGEGQGWVVWPLVECALIPAPPYNSAYFDSTMLPFDDDPFTEQFYDDLKALAVRTGTYCKHTASSTLNIPPGNAACNAPAAIESLEAAGEKFFVLYIEITGSGDVAIKRGWGPQGQDPLLWTCDGSFGLIVIRNGDLSWQNTNNWWGAALVPEGKFSGAGSGANSGTWFVGSLYAQTLRNAGNVTFIRNDCWLESLPGAFFNLGRLRWHENDG